jgi:DNA invertase Pin-like site-specific DNA recombinase
MNSRSKPPQPKKPLIAYYRVSTDKQERSGLGLEGQEAAVKKHAEIHGAEILRGYTEVETGKRSDRPQLAEALADCRLSQAVLCIAKLDRLSRNVHFLAGLMDSKVEFVCCDNPNATRLTLHILAAVAEDETRRISERTKAALAAYKARGGKLGSKRRGAHRLTGGANPKAAKRAGEVAAANADAAYVGVAKLMQELKSQGLSLRAIAARLNKKGHKTRRGKPWSPTQVKRVLERAKPAKYG